PELGRSGGGTEQFGTPLHGWQRSPEELCAGVYVVRASPGRSKPQASCATHESCTDRPRSTIGKGLDQETHDAGRERRTAGNALAVARNSRHSPNHVVARLASSHLCVAVLGECCSTSIPWTAESGTL